MYRTEVALALKEAIIANKNTLGSVGFRPDTDLAVIDALDPLVNKDVLVKHIFCIPAYNEYTLGNVRASGRSRGLGSNKDVFIILSVGYSLDLVRTSDDPHDVVSASTWRKLVNLSEDLEEFAVSWSHADLKLSSIDTSPPDEDHLNNRIYLATTILGFRTC